MSDNSSLNLALWILVSLLSGGYLIPTTIAGIRHHTDILPIFVLNVLFGWTIIGWIIAFVWSLT